LFRRVGIVVVLGACAVGAAAWYAATSRSPEEVLAAAQAALAEGRPADAERWAAELLASAEDKNSAILICAQAAVATGRVDQCLAYLDQLDDDGSDEALRGLSHQAELLLQLGRASEAEAKFRQILARRRSDAQANRRLAFLLAVEGRRRESEPYLVALLRSGEITLEELALLGNLTPDYELTSENVRYLDALPEDPLPLLGLARSAAHRSRYAQAEQWLRRVIARYPDLVEAQVWLGWVLLQSDQREAFAAWDAALSSAAQEHPQLWYMRGLAARQRQQLHAAARCFWETIQRDGNHQAANTQLAVTLTLIDQADAAKPFRHRGKLLGRLAGQLQAIHQTTGRALTSADIAEIREIIASLEQLGRTVEALAWCKLAGNSDGSSRGTRPACARLQSLVTDDTPRCPREANPAYDLDLSAYPLPQWNVSPGKVADAESNDRSGTHFGEVAADRGIAFVYDNGGDEQTAGMRLFETTGGGVGVIDFDLDGWPDIHFTQGCQVPPDPAQRRRLDQLYRNLDGERFEEIGSLAGVDDNRFSQGVAVGDFDGDGFADIYLANIGSNRLYRNNGDGTFTDVAERAGLVNDDWTTSCLIADLNGDALPDLYEVNYVGGEHNRQCLVDGHPRSCPPSDFPAGNDRLFLNAGDGRFQDVSAAAGIVVPDGKGLGIVAADLDQSGRLSLYVANDGTPNFLFANQTEAPGDPPRFEERALTSGLAVDASGLAQASMGIAAGDADQDGWLDLFVTNFFAESNTFYHHQPPDELFIDESAMRGLRAPSLQRLGFGTQFLDGDLDGWPDLLVTNGHIDDFRFRGEGFQMPAEFFRNVGAGNFIELPPITVGKFFQSKHLGRGLARLDWNRDGRDEAVISHMNAPAALLLNQTETSGNFVAVQLRGVRSVRDAIGTIVQVETENRRFVRQLTAGDGYQASNERQLVFGLGDATSVKRLVVRWPAGGQQEFAPIRINSRALLIEGMNDLVYLDK